MMNKPEDMLVALKKWEQDLAVYFLPSWEDLPTIELYMDQVVALMGQYLAITDQKSETHLPVITASTINN